MLDGELAVPTPGEQKEGMMRRIAYPVLALLVALTTLLVSVPIESAVQPPSPSATTTPYPTPVSATILPSSFWGTITLNPPSDDTNLWGFGAEINRNWVASVRTTKSEGKYVYSVVVPADNPATERIEGGVEGASITFGLAQASSGKSDSSDNYTYEIDGSGTWHSGTNVELNLTARLVPSPQVAFASISDQPLLIYAQEPSDPQNWEVYDQRAPSYANTLSLIRRGRGYWIKVNSATTLTYGGRSYPLAPGWNLVGWMG